MLGLCNITKLEVLYGFRFYLVTKIVGGVVHGVLREGAHFVPQVVFVCVVVSQLANRLRPALRV